MSAVDVDGSAEGTTGGGVRRPDVRSRAARPGPGGTWSHGPSARPKGGVAPRLPSVAAHRAPVRACRPGPDGRPGPEAAASNWRWTDRGMAVVLVITAMIVMAALAVVVPTALRVTGDSYRPYGSTGIVAP